MKPLTLLAIVLCLAAVPAKDIILQSDFDNPDPAKNWPGDRDIVSKDLPKGSTGGVARAIARKDGKGKWIRLGIDPHKAVGAQTMLRFRYHLTGANRLTTQIFDVTDQDNRHVNLRDLKQGEWADAEVNFSKDGRRNDGNQNAFAAGHKVDDLFFFVDGENVTLLIDEVVLYDGAAKP